MAAHGNEGDDEWFIYEGGDLGKEVMKPRVPDPRR